jgi:hypothetical protein
MIRLDCVEIPNSGLYRPKEIPKTIIVAVLFLPRSIFEVADKMNGVVVSNDRYKDLCKNYRPGQLEKDCRH